MDSATPTAPVSKARLWTSYVLSALPVLMMVISGSMKVFAPPQLLEGMAHFGYPGHLARPIGILELTCALLYVVPRTSILGAVLVAAYLGGATATHVRIGEPFFVPVLLGVMAWLGLWLREPRLHALAPLRK